MSRNFILLTAAVTLVCGSACAAPHELSGTWKFAKNAVYFGDAKTIPFPQYPTIQLVDGKLFLQPRCDTPIDYSRVKYDYDELFQMALKAGVDDKAMDKFTKKHLGAPLSSVKYFYQGNKALAQCNFEHAHVFMLNDKLVLVNGAGVFSAYERAPVPAAAETAPNLYGRKLSQLPYNGGSFNVLCSGLIGQKNGVPQPTDACAPVFYPYAASKADTDPLGKLIGSHPYRKSGAEAEKDYDNPVAHGLHPVYMLFQPMKDVLVAAVEDIEQGESSGRSGMTGVYLSIKGGKVVDQITGECLLQADSSCTYINGEKVYQLLDTGKFVKVKK